MNYKQPSLKDRKAVRIKREHYDLIKARANGRIYLFNAIDEVVEAGLRAKRMLLHDKIPVSTIPQDETR